MAFGDRAILIILDEANAPFDKVAFSPVVAKTAVVANKLTSLTIHPKDPFGLVSFSTLLTWILSPMSYGRRIKINSHPSNI
jgi:hypothetical protein